MDLVKWLYFYVMDVVGEFVFGVFFGFVEKGNDLNNFLVGVSNLLYWGSIVGWFFVIF